jgi:hypothetical protein
VSTIEMPVDKAGKISGRILEGFVFHQVDGLDLQSLTKLSWMGLRAGLLRLHFDFFEYYQFFDAVR